MGGMKLHITSVCWIAIELIAGNRCIFCPTSQANLNTVTHCNRHDSLLKCRLHLLIRFSEDVEKTSNLQKRRDAIAMP